MNDFNQQKQQGVVIIIVLMVAALGVILFESMLSDMNLSVSQSSRLKQQRQADYYAMGAEAYARQILYDDMKRGEETKLQVDHLGERWSTVRQGFEVDGGLIEMEIIDLQSKFNLNNITQEKEFNQLKRLLRILNLNEDIAVLLLDWIDRDINARLGGAEDATYLGFDIPYRTANQIIFSPSEMRLLAGSEDNDYHKLFQYVTVMPPSSLINVNTASEIVLQSLSENFSESNAANIIAERQAQPFKSVNEFLEKDIPEDLKKNPAFIGVTSSTFEIKIKVSYGDSVSYFVSVVHRDTEGKTKVLRRDMGQVFTIINNEDSDEWQF